MQLFFFLCYIAGCYMCSNPPIVIHTSENWFQRVYATRALKQISRVIYVCHSSGPHNTAEKGLTVQYCITSYLSLFLRVTIFPYTQGSFRLKVNLFPFSLPPIKICTFWWLHSVQYLLDVPSPRMTALQPPAVHVLLSSQGKLRESCAQEYIV